MSFAACMTSALFDNAGGVCLTYNQMKLITLYVDPGEAQAAGARLRAADMRQHPRVAPYPSRPRSEATDHWG